MSSDGKSPRKRTFAEELERQRNAKSMKKDDNRHLSSSLISNNFNNSIKARVTHARLATFSQRDCFIMTLMDEEGVEIGASAWGQNAFHFKNLLKVNEIYMMTGLRVTPSNGFSRTKHPLEIYFNARSTVTLIEGPNFPSLTYSFNDMWTISKTAAENEVVDLVGILFANSTVNGEIILTDGSTVDTVVNISRISSIINEQQLTAMSTIVTLKGVKVTKILETVMNVDCFSDSVFKIGDNTCPEVQALENWRGSAP